MMVQAFVEAFAADRYDLIANAHITPDGPQFNLVVRNKQGEQMGVPMQLIAQETLYTDSTLTTLRPETLALLRTELPERTGNEDLGIRNHTLTVTHAITTEPFTRRLTRLAHLPVLLLDLYSTGRYASRRAAELDAQAQLDHLYGTAPETPVNIEPEHGLQG